MARRKRKEANAPAPRFSGAWESDTAAFTDAARFIRALESARALEGGVPDERRADEMIRAYCSKVRRSRGTLMGSLSRGYRLDNVGIVATTVVLLAYMTSIGSFNLFRVFTLAAGLSIADLSRLRRHVERRTGFMRLMEKHDQNIFPKPEILCMAPGNDYWWKPLREQIDALPVKNGREE